MRNGSGRVIILVSLWHIDGRAMYYRKDIFADKGIDAPTTLGRFHDRSYKAK